MKLLISVFVTAAMMLPTSILAAPVISGSNAGTGSATATGTGTGLGGNAYAPTTFQTPTVSKVDGMENNGKDGSQQQGGGMDASMMAAMAMGAVAAGTCPACGKRGTCPICMAAIAGAVASMAAGKQMSQAKMTSNTQVKDVNPVTPIPGAEAPPIEESKAYQTALKDLKTATKSIGATASKDGTKITLSDGSVIDAASGPPGGSYSPTASEQAMINSALSKAKADMAAMAGQDGAGSIAEINEDGGGAGGSGGTSTSATAMAEGAQAGSGAARKPSSVVGMSRDFNGDRIGVAQDSLFGMLHRRYQLHNNNNSFLPAGQ